jgi:hypothetical protein
LYSEQDQIILELPKGDSSLLGCLHLYEVLAAALPSFTAEINGK